MIIMGIDPGTRVTGYGIIRKKKNSFDPLDFGCIRPPPKEAIDKKYLILFESVDILLNKFRPDAVAIETQFVKKNVQSAMKLGMARGVIILAAARLAIPVSEFAPKKIKLAVVGSGDASKPQVQKMIQMLLKLKKIPPEDAADALAVAICLAHQIKEVQYV